MKPIVLSGRRNDPRRALQILAIILLNILVIAMLPGARDGAYPTLSKVGSQGEEVRQIQTKLKNWGYLNDRVDGIYGPKTRDAVDRKSVV